MIWFYLFFNERANLIHGQSEARGAYQRDYPKNRRARIVDENLNEIKQAQNVDHEVAQNSSGLQKEVRIKELINSKNSPLICRKTGLS